MPGVRSLLRHAQHNLASSRQDLNEALTKAEASDYTIRWAPTIQTTLTELAKVELRLSDFRQAIKNPPKPLT